MIPPTVLKYSLSLVLLALVASVGCSSGANKNVADAPQSEIDKYNALIEAEAAKAKEAGDKKNI